MLSLLQDGYLTRSLGSAPLRSSWAIGVDVGWALEFESGDSRVFEGNELPWA